MSRLPKRKSHAGAAIHIVTNRLIRIADRIGIRDAPTAHAPEMALMTRIDLVKDDPDADDPSQTIEMVQELMVAAS